VPTRTTNSHASEGETNFLAGDLQAAINSYRKAVALDPNQAQIRAELARIQVYSSKLLTTDAERKARLEEALATINEAVQIDPESSTVHAVRSFVLDWNSEPSLAGDKSSEMLTEAETEAVRALQLDPQNALALAYYAEILVDEQRWQQAEQYIEQAIERDPNQMDVQRVRAYVSESQTDYLGAIEAYRQAIRITPNLTFLHISAGLNYRVLAQNATAEEIRDGIQKQYYDAALEYFTQAVNIKDPLPYIAIAKTYSQMGEFFSASRNISKAVAYNPYNADIYGQMGIIYFKGRNYEGSIPALKCAVRGCTAAESCEVRQCDPESDPPIEIQPLPLSQTTVVYYYTYGSVLAGLHRGDESVRRSARRI
jgi:tetratricopeptide (TPR) repeat protein